MVFRLSQPPSSILATVAGGLAPLSFAPFKIWPMGVISLFFFLMALASSTPKQAFFRGWLYGLGFFGVGASWIYFSIHEYGFTSVPFALLLTGLFVAGLALLLSATFAYLYVKIFSQREYCVLVSFPALWVLFEWLRSWLLTGFPWLYLGNAHIDTWLSGWAPIMGVYGLSFIVAATAALMFQCLKKPFSQWRWGHYVAILLILSTWSAGLTLQSMNWSHAYGEPLQVTLVQPNISQHIKWRPEQQPITLRLLESTSAQHQDSDIIVWPENAIPLFAHQATRYLSRLNILGEESHTTFISGIPYWQPETRNNPRKLHNSVITFGDGTDSIYHKQKLVPFGEYVPFQHLLRGLIQFFDLPMSDFGPGPKNQQPLRIKKDGYSILIAPYICYEIVYPDFVRHLAKSSDFLLTISDDSWFGSSIGPHQHLEMARMRALENQRYLIRGTNTGITAIVDQSGRTLDQAEQFQQTSLTGQVRLMSGLTPFTRWGSTPILLLCLIFLIVSCSRRSRQ